MYYVVAHDHYYPSGGFSDIKFKGSSDDCHLVAAVLIQRYDFVYVTECNTSTTLSDWI